MRIAESVGGGGEVAGRLRKIDYTRAVGVKLAALFLSRTVGQLGGSEYFFCQELLVNLAAASREMSLW
ncbi:MAG: hypothetical protein ACYSW3_13000 [Planctomycetota bacterium]